ncbi:MltA-interacting MipA family protein [Vibrio sp. UCD-FRSSP16_10]|uniref:MipA/OmpV family protein n=1 Tax=unclassified Vibrio TaxID=2614977 RepID=UPI0007FBE635|nr:MULTISPECIES: MipA/OmpV family protein [unclassified Vibrio]OBT13177.1 MltA-interacting MipA family protein [Vibrio sp. UCD-FRSSP16_30]OBT19578.1 MltA-interacting MipA family protein [Vibrio sp. UCD-FRSSP16_10]
MNTVKPRVLAASLLVALSPAMAENKAEKTVEEKPLATAARAQTQTEPPLESQNPEQTWGLAGVVRSASVPYVNGLDLDDAERVTTFIPMLYFENDYVYVKGLTIGGYVYNPKDSDWNVSLLGRLRFVDIPAEIQNAYGADALDMGLRGEYQYSEDWFAYSELMTDKHGNWYTTLGTEGEYAFGSLTLQPHASLRLKSSDFNSAYYALGFEDIDAGVDYFAGIRANYHVISNLYLLGAVNLHMLDNNAEHSAVIDDQLQTEYYLGIGFFNDPDKKRKSHLSNKPYLRIAHGWGTPSNLGDIIGGEIEDDPYNSQLTSLFYGHPLTDSLFGLPLDIYLTPGFAWHWSHQDQASSQEYILAIKAYYTFTWPFDWRFGVAEGMSYTSKINSLEKNEFATKGKEPNNFLNYLDFSLDVNLGSMFNARSIDNVWLGYSIHHRSAIFEKSSQYGRIKGGSNYNSVYVQFDF